ncbi:MAG: Ig-like domain-containing protein [Vulcanimicrobiota bacterium]
MNKSRRLVASALTFGLGLTFWGCSTSTITDQPVPGFIPNPAVTGGAGITFPLFDPSATTSLQIPIPNDVLRNPGTVDPTKKGLIDFPNVAAFNVEPFVSAETIRGWSTTANIIIPFSGRIDAASVTPQSLMLVEGGSAVASPEPAGPNVTIPCTVVVRNPEPSTTGNSTIVMTPVRPLKPATNYYVTMTTAIQGNGRSIGTAPVMQASKQRTPLTDGSGNNNVFPVPQDTALTLEGLRQGFQPFWQRAESILGTDRANIPIVIRFGTQPELAALAGLRSKTGSTNVADISTSAVINGTFTFSNQAVPIRGNGAVGTPGTVKDFYAGGSNTNLNPTNLALGAVANNNIDRIATGNVTLKNYYQTTGRWDGEGFGSITAPIAEAPSAVPGLGDLRTLVHPYICCLPAAGGNLKTVIYQHGIGRSKEDVFLIADALCAKGFAVIAIDMPYHGNYPAPFGKPTPPITSEQAFLNLQAPRNARDNFRQAAVNLHYLTQIMGAGTALNGGNILLSRNIVDPNLATLTLLGAGSPPGSTPPVVPPATPGIHYVGHSLGGLVGGIYSATEPYSQRAVLSCAGGRFLSLLLNSTTRSPAFLGFLNAAGVTPGSQSFDLFCLASQTVVDDADPINYAAPALEGVLKSTVPGEFFFRASRVLLQEMINDETIPNSSSRDLATAFGYDSNAFGFNALRPTPFRHVEAVLAAVPTLQVIAAPYNAIVAGVSDASGLSQFAPGTHETLLGNGGNAATTARMQTQIGNFVDTGAITTNQ